MFAKLTIAALATVLVGLGATSEAAYARARTAPPMAQGREVAAPPWAFTCINDQGPTQCGEPIWVYGNVR